MAPGPKRSRRFAPVQRPHRPRKKRKRWARANTAAGRSVGTPGNVSSSKRTKARHLHKERRGSNRVLRHEANKRAAQQPTRASPEREAREKERVGCGDYCPWCMRIHPPWHECCGFVSDNSMGGSGRSSSQPPRTMKKCSTSSTANRGSNTACVASVPCHTVNCFVG